MTVITVVAIAAVAAFFYALIWPNVKASVANNQCEAECGKGHFERATADKFRDNRNEEDSVNDWSCECDFNKK